MSGKLGLGLYENKPELAADANTVGASAVLLFERALDLAYQIAPGIEIIGRAFWSTEDQDAMLLSLDLEGLRTLGLWQAHSLCSNWPRVDCWQALNEVMRAPKPVGHPDRTATLKAAIDWLQRNIAFDLGFADGCAAHGKTACVVNAPPGVEPTPDSDPEFFAIYANEVKPLLEHPAVKYWGRHVYSKGATLPLSDDPSWYALRHRKIVAGLRALDVRVPAIAITELGWANGWRATGFEDYQAADDLEQFADSVLDDSDIAHLMVFCDGNSGGWYEHDIHATGIIGRMADWNRALPDAPAIPQEEQPMAEDTRIQQLLDQNAIITAALIDFRHGRFEGADGMDGKIVALNGGVLPDGWAPSYPPLA